MRQTAGSVQRISTCELHSDVRVVLIISEETRIAQVLEYEVSLPDATEWIRAYGNGHRIWPKAWRCRTSCKHLAWRGGALRVFRSAMLCLQHTNGWVQLRGRWKETSKEGADSRAHEHVRQIPPSEVGTKREATNEVCEWDLHPGSVTGPLGGTAENNRKEHHD